MGHFAGSAVPRQSATTGSQPRAATPRHLAEGNKAPGEGSGRKSPHVAQSFCAHLHQPGARGRERSGRVVSHVPPDVLIASLARVGPLCTTAHPPASGTHLGAVRKHARSRKVTTHWGCLLPAVTNAPARCSRSALCSTPALDSEQGPGQFEPDLDFLSKVVGSAKSVAIPLQGLLPGEWFLSPGSLAAAEPQRRDKAAEHDPRG